MRLSRFRFLCVVVGLALASTVPLSGQGPFESLSFEPFANGLVQPVSISHAGDGSGRLFIVEQAGRIRVHDGDDWDMTTLGDPLIDLGTLLNYWPDPADGDHSRGSQLGMQSMGLPGRSEVRKLYAEKSGLDVSRAGWYEAFAQWKTATVVAQLHHRWAVGDSTDPRMEAIAARVPVLARAAARLLDELD